MDYESIETFVDVGFYKSYVCRRSEDGSEFMTSNWLSDIFFRLENVLPPSVTFYKIGRNSHRTSVMPSIKFQIQKYLAFFSFLLIRVPIPRSCLRATDLTASLSQANNSNIIYLYIIVAYICIQLQII